LAAINPAAAALKSEVKVAILAEAERVGVDGLKRVAIMKRFAGRGVSEATLYRWIDSILAGGMADQHMARVIEAAAAERIARDPEPGRSIAAEVRTKLPTAPKVEHIATAGVIPVIERLDICLAAADQLMAHSRTEEGKVRNSKLLLASSEHLRRCIETAAKITDTLMRGEKVERYHAAIIEEIAKESPLLAERVLMRISQLTNAWGNA
jgi:hypothetical protein